MPHALILAGGERASGEAAEELGLATPMSKLGGKPILEHQIDILRDQAITNVLILAGDEIDAIQEHFGDGSRFGVEVGYAVDYEPAGRSGALRRAFELVPTGDEFVLAMNGDMLSLQPLRPLIRSHVRRAALATMMLVPLVSRYGIVGLDRQGRVTGFAEKPLLRQWANGGLYVLATEFFRRLEDSGDPETVTFPRLAEEGSLSGFKSRAYWRSIETKADLADVAAELAAAALTRSAASRST